MINRLLPIVLLGLLLFAIGAVILGLSLQEEFHFSVPAILGGYASLSAGIYLLLFARRTATTHATAMLTPAGIWFYGVFVLLLGVLLVVSFVSFINPQRGAFFYSGAGVLIILSTLAGRMLARRGVHLMRSRTEL